MSSQLNLNTFFDNYLNSNFTLEKFVELDPSEAAFWKGPSNFYPHISSYLTKPSKSRSRINAILTRLGKLIIKESKYLDNQSENQINLFSIPPSTQTQSNLQASISKAYAKIIRESEAWSPEEKGQCEILRHKLQSNGIHLVEDNQPFQHLSIFCKGSSEPINIQEDIVSLLSRMTPSLNGKASVYLPFYSHNVASMLEHIQMEELAFIDKEDIIELIHLANYLGLECLEKRYSSYLREELFLRQHAYSLSDTVTLLHGGRFLNPEIIQCCLEWLILQCSLKIESPFEAEQALLLAGGIERDAIRQFATALLKLTCVFSQKPVSTPEYLEIKETLEKLVLCSKSFTGDFEFESSRGCGIANGPILSNIDPFTIAQPRGFVMINSPQKLGSRARATQNAGQEFSHYFELGQLICKAIGYVKGLASEDNFENCQFGTEYLAYIATRGKCKPPKILEELNKKFLSSVRTSNSEYPHLFYIKAFITKDHDAAKKNLKKALEINPFFTKAYTTTSVLVNGMGNLAQQILKEGLQSCVRNTHLLHYRLAKHYHTKGDDLAALKELDTAINKAPNKKAYVIRALIYKQLCMPREELNDRMEIYSKYERSEEVLERIAELKYELNQYAFAIKDYTQLLDSCKKRGIHEVGYYHMYRGASFYFLHDFGAAYQDLCQVRSKPLQQNDVFLDAFFGTLLQLKKYHEALSFTLSSSIADGGMKYFWNALCYYFLQNFDKALEYSNKAGTCDINQKPDALALNSLIYLSKGQYAEAIASLNGSLLFKETDFALQARSILHLLNNNKDLAYLDIQRGLKAFKETTVFHRLFIEFISKYQGASLAEKYITETPGLQERLLKEEREAFLASEREIAWKTSNFFR